MRVLLIYPNLSTLERYSSDIGNAGGHQIPLGVFYLASYLLKHGHEAKVIDGEAQGLSAPELVSQALGYRPDLVGISATTVAFRRACEVARDIKSRSPRTPVVLGGPHITASARDAMQNPDFDFGIIGEGEVTLLALVEALQNQNNLSAVKGIVFREKGSLRINPPRTPVPNVDILPFPAYDLVSNFSHYNPPPCNYKKLPAVNIITGRGCPNQCTFCDRSVFGQKLRQRSPENIAEEIEVLYHRYGAREIAFVDDTFTLRPQRLFKLFDILEGKGLRFPWTCMSRINTVDYEILKFMRDKGCWHVSFGIESGSKEILSRIKKNISLDAALKVVQYCRSLGLQSKGFFMLGHPGETKETIDQTIQTALDMPLDDMVVTLNTPLPGTTQYQEAHLYGDLSGTDWSQFNMWNPVFVPHGLSPELLLEKHREFYRRFYLRPRIIMHYIWSFFSRTGLRRLRALVLSLPFLLKGR